MEQFIENPSDVSILFKLFSLASWDIVIKQTYLIVA